MLWGASDFFARIDRWKQEVVKNTLQQPPTQGRSQKYEAHHMKLRSRPALAEVSGNPYSRKRNSAAMADASPRKYGKKAVIDENAEGVARRSGRGRPPKNRQIDTEEAEPMKQSASRPQSQSANNAELANSRESSLPIRAEVPSSIWSPSRSASSRKAGTSPSKKGQITLDKPMSEAAIDMDYLSRCDPAVHLITFRELKLEGIEIPSPVDDLFRKLQGVPIGLIPDALKVSSSSSQRYLKPANTCSACIRRRCQHPTQIKGATFGFVLLAI